MLDQKRAVQSMIKNKRSYFHWSFLRVIALALSLAACSPLTVVSENDANSDSTPSSESSQKLEENPQPISSIDQVVVLTTLGSDIVHTLAADKLVGIPGSRLLQVDDRFQDITVVSEGRTEPNLEKIVALEPDLVVGATGFHDKTLQRLEDFDIKTLAVNVDSWQSLRTFTVDLADLLDADPQPLLSRYDACLAKAPTSGPTTIVLASREPLLSPNQKSWAGDMLMKFNLPNLVADFQGDSPFDGYITLSEEKLLEANPEQLLVVNTNENLLEQLKADPFWQSLKATQTEQVYEFDYFGLVNPGSLQSIETVCEQLSQLSR